MESPTICTHKKKSKHSVCRKCFLGVEAFDKEKDRLRKVRRKRHLNNSWRKSRCNCGEDPYCYCGDGTPYSY